MLRFLSFVVTCVLVHLGHGQMSCPGNAQQRVMECAGLLQGFGQASSPSEQQQQCGDARRGFTCLRDLVEECQGIEGTPLGQMVSSFNQMEGQINAICPSTAPTESVPVPNRVSTCSRKDKRKMQKCARRMQRYGAETPVRCSKVRRVTTCMATLMERCSSVIDPSLVSRINHLQQILTGSCVETNLIEDETDEVENPEDNPNDNEASEEPSCPDDYSTTLQRCVGGLNQQMGNIVGNGDMSSVPCQQIYADLDCTNHIFSTCSNMSEVRAVSAGFDVDQIRDYIARFCPPGGLETNLETEGEGTLCSVFNPAVEIQRCNGFLTSFQSDPDSMEEECMALYDGFDCFRNLIRRCPNDPDVTAFTSVVDIESARDSMSVYCPSKK